MAEITWTETEIDIQADLEIGSDLEDEWRRHAVKYARWAFLFARAEDELLAAEEGLELCFSVLYQAYKRNNEDSKENEAKAYVRKHDSYKKAQRLRRRKRKARDTLKLGLKAFEAREKMLSQLGAQSRHEENATRGSTPTPTQPVPRRTKERRGKTQLAADVIATKRTGDSEDG